MTNLDLDTIVSAWRDAEYLEDLPPTTRSRLPANPAGDLGAAVLDPMAASSTFISDTCSTFISDCCSTFISNTCSTFISDCC